MQELSKVIIGYFQSQNYLYAIFVILVAVLFNINNIMIFLKSVKKKSYADELHEVLKCEHFDNDFRTYLKNELQREYFYKFCKLPAEHYFREQLFQLHEFSRGNINFNDFRNAAQLITFTDNKLFVSLSWYVTFVYFFNKTIFLILILLATSYLTLPSFFLPGNFNLIIPGTILSLVLFAFAVYLVPQLRAYESAKLIQKELIKMEKSKKDEHLNEAVVTS